MTNNNHPDSIQSEKTNPNQDIQKSNPKAQAGILLTLLVIVAVLVILLILGIHFLKQNLEMPAFREAPQIYQLLKR